MEEWQVDPVIRYAQLCKHKVRRKLIDTEAVGMISDLSEIEGLLCRYGYSGKIQTSYIERLNVDLRSDIAALARRTNALVRSSKQLFQVMTLWQGCHNFCRSHRSLKLNKTVQSDAKLRERHQPWPQTLLTRFGPSNVSYERRLSRHLAKFLSQAAD